MYSSELSNLLNILLTIIIIIGIHDDTREINLI